MPQARYHVVFRIDIDVPKHAKSPQVIYSCHMIVMNVGEQHPVQLTERNPKQGHTDVWTTIYEQACRLALYHRGRAETPVPRVSAVAHSTITTQDRNTSGCSSSQKRHSHRIFTSGYISTPKRRRTSFLIRSHN